MNKLTLAALAGAVLLASLLPASAAKLNFPKGDAAWTVDIEQLGIGMGDPAIAAEAGKVWATKVDIVRTGDARRDLVTWSNGKTTEAWWYSGPPKIYMSVGPIKGRTTYITPDETTVSKLLDNSFFKWVAQATLVKSGKVDGTDCQVYAATVTRDQVAEKLTVWVDKETRRPVRLVIDNTQYSFTFGEPPTSQLQLPQKLVDKVKRVKAVAGME